MTTPHRVTAFTLAAGFTLANLCIAATSRHHRHRAEAAAARAHAANERTRTVTRLLAALAPAESTEELTP